ncbi:hypothetical protein CGC58_09150 [Capnocytophaga stomatis]|uniref:Esterase n=1 Tax=Capnocytophaga stomatis TaxID=1848904 RepID=A0A250FZS3_9FLAO|nr:hypothetical protein [Capnocytophaga stomatis]ATA90649.1 hypothetical protein CGC58_09150 [Capnocytophaga stomatis]
MNRIFSLLALTTLLFTSCTKKEHSDAPNGKEVPQSEQETPKENTSEESVKPFFADHLAGKTGLFQEGKKLSIAEIPNAQQEIWKAWKEANEKFSEQKLGALNPLNSRTSSKWNIPENLEKNAVMPYYYGYKGSKPQEGYPLFLYLHGSSDKHQEWAAGIALGEAFNDAPSAYFIPQIPNTGALYRWWQKGKQFAWEKLLRLAFLSGDIDANKVYFFGISEGGYGSQRLASFYADYLAGVGPMAGGEPLINAPVENCRNIAFSLRTGEQDYMFHRDLLTRYTQEAFEKHQQADPEGFVHHIELIPRMGHDINYFPTTPWLKQYKRNPHPKKVVWEDFPMDGIYRKGFYNIAVQERTSDRTRYTMEITDNTINVQVDAVTYQGVEKSPRWNFFTKYEKTHVPASKGKFTLYLNAQLVDLGKEITVIVNGKQVFKGIAQPDTKHLINSCSIFFDPERLFPSAVEIAF